MPYANFRNVTWADDNTLVCFNGPVKQTLVVVDAETGKVKHAYAKEVLLNQLPKKTNYEPALWLSGVPGTTKACVRAQYNHAGWNDMSFLLDWQTGEATKGYRKVSLYGCPAAAVAPDLSIGAQGDGDLNDIILFDPTKGEALPDGKGVRRLRPAVRGAFARSDSIRWRADGKAVVWRQHDDGPHKGHAELDLTTLMLRPLNAGEFRQVDRDLADFAHAMDFPPAEGVLPVGAKGKPLNLDFETGTLEDWVATGKAFDGQPIKGDTVALRVKGERSGHQGKYWIGGFEKLRNDKPQGTLTSVPFKITQPWASFLVGGGPSQHTRVDLVLQDQKEELLIGLVPLGSAPGVLFVVKYQKAFFSASGWQEETLRRVVVDLRPHLGKEMFIRVVDAHSGRWGHISFDDFRLHAKQPGVSTPPYGGGARERGIVRQRGPLTLTVKWPDLIITGGSEPVIDKAKGPVWSDSTFAAGGRIVSYHYYWNALQVFDPATGKADVKTVTRSFIQSLAVSPRPDCRYILVGSVDQTLTVFDPAAGKVLLTIFPARQDWIAWTPEGYYAATPAGERLMGWHVENGPDKLASFYPAERFRKKFHRPDVIQLVLEKGSVAEALKAADAALKQKTKVLPLEQLLPPQTVLTVVDDTRLPTLKLKATATAHSRQQPITGLRLLLDGRPLPPNEKGEKEGVAEFAAGKDKADADWTITLPEGTHQLAVLAQPRRLGHLAGHRADQRQSGQAAEAARARRRRGCLPQRHSAAAVCRGRCQGHRRRVPAQTRWPVPARRQSDTAQPRCAPQGRARCPCQPVRPGQGQRSGSGLVCRSRRQGQERLLPADGRGRSAEAAGDGAFRRGPAQGIGKIPCQVLLLLDACRAGGAIKNFRPVVDDLTRELTDDDCGVAVLSAAMANEQAQERDGHGLFTRAVVDALQPANGMHFNRHDHLVYVHHLHSYVFDEVARQSDRKQHPSLSLPSIVESFPITKVK